MNTSNKENIKEKKKRLMALHRKYGTRITTARKAREAFGAKDYIKATKLYQDYLSTLAELKEVEDIYKLSTKNFNEKTEITNVQLVDGVYKGNELNWLADVWWSMINSNEFIFNH